MHVSISVRQIISRVSKQRNFLVHLMIKLGRRVQQGRFDKERMPQTEVRDVQDAHRSMYKTVQTGAAKTLYATFATVASTTSNPYRSKSPKPTEMPYTLCNLMIYKGRLTSKIWISFATV